MDWCWPRSWGGFGSAELLKREIGIGGARGLPVIGIELAQGKQATLNPCRNHAKSLAGAFGQIVAAEGFELLPVTARHAARAGFINAAHRDPFDRILAAQTEIEELTLATNDGRFAEFGTRTVWG